MASDLQDFTEMLERAGIDHTVESFVERNDVILTHHGVTFIFNNAGGLVEVDRTAS